MTDDDEGFIMRVPTLVSAGLAWALWVGVSAATGERAAGVVVLLLALAGLATDGLLAIDVQFGEIELRRTLERLDCRRREAVHGVLRWDGQSSLLIDGRVFRVVETGRANTPLVDAEGDGG